MGIFGALTTAVSGMRAQSYALENISGNIANARTTGFKRVDTSFVDLVPDTAPRRELSGSVNAFARATHTVQGDLNTTGIGTHIAINGEGYFVVQQRTGFAGGQPTFGGIDVYTRRGDFERDRSGFLVNGAGFYLKGIPLDPATGALQGSNPQLIRITESNIPPRQTSNVQYVATLPSFPETAYLRQINSTNPADALITSGVTYAAGAPPATVTGGEAQQFIDRTIEGGSITIYNQQGAAKSLSMRWGKVANAPERWALYYNENQNAGPADVAWRMAGAPFTFNAAGQMAPPTNISLPAFTIDGIPYDPITINTSSVQSFPAEDLNANRTGAKVALLQQDGYPSGEFQGVSIDTGGRVVGSYTNGQVVGLAQIVLAQFQADNSLKRRDGGVFEATLESGPAIIEQAGGRVQGGAVENSNVDIADEFSKMIVTQQAYTANTRVISTSADMLRDAINIIR